MSRRTLAVGQAVLVTFLWSTSWVLITVGLERYALPPLTFAGLRYVLAAMVLLPLALPALRRLGVERLRAAPLGRLALLGVILYAVTQGAQFAALVHLPAVAVALALSTTPVVVALVARRGGEPPSLAQVGGALLLVVGAAIYFGPLTLGPGPELGLAIAAVGVLANAAAAVIGRGMARDQVERVGGVIGMTALSMAVGSVVLLGAGLAVEGLPALPIEAWLVIGWLAVVNTAVAFTLWNHTLRTLSAVESSVLNNLMLVQIAILAWVFLGQSLDAREVAGLALALAGIVAVQLAGSRREAGQRVVADLAGPTDG
ncbi:MAG TPA: DMT family transporter [Candidatus Limnocylindrales bacterium]